MKNIELTRKEIDSVALRLLDIDIQSPQEIERKLRGLGFHGQDEACRAASVMAYLHLRRLRQVFIDQVPYSELPPRANYLLMGASGSGKTHLVDLLFREILKLPCLTVDITQYTETGFVGEEVSAIFNSLIDKAGGARAWAATGVVLIDEFDKLSTDRSSGGDRRDVGGMGVQRSLLTLLGSRIASHNPQRPGDREYHLPIWNITFIAAGAFYGIHKRKPVPEERLPTIGFNSSNREAKRNETLFAPIDNSILCNTKLFAEMGFLPELIGRFSRIVPFQPLDETVLQGIFESNILPTYIQMFQDEGFNLDVQPRVREFLVKQTLKRETGARGFQAALLPVLERAIFDRFGQNNTTPTDVVLSLDGEDQIQIEYKESDTLEADQRHKTAA